MRRAVLAIQIVVYVAACSDDPGAGVDSGASDAGSGVDASTSHDAGHDGSDAASMDAGPELDAAIDLDAGADAAIESDAAPACDGRCVPVVPEGWTGPLALIEGGTARACDGAWSTEADVAHGDLQGALDACGCACTATGSPVPGFRVRANDATGSCPAPAAPDYLLTPDQCTMTSSMLTASGAAAARLEMVGPVPVGGCSVSDALPAWSWAIESRACSASGAASGACDPGGLCVPATADAICIEHEGDVACPGTDYTERRVRFRDVTDTRVCGCGTCTLSGWTVTSGPEVMASSGGAGPPVMTCFSAPTNISVPTTAGSCYTPPIGTPSNSWFTRGGAVSGATTGCTVSPASPQGTLEPATAVTICCTGPG